ncbi:hypothetical protein SAMN05216215_101577 [Saccharopolyspora shandongensis]|uniref:S-(Hydroxymethyl)glutathione dehydrogenase / alcohol dehydrogenase n=1 Tax=Saccharopolyspora shandongensis TaxID=418495 RepID=A0A1H3EMF3_9PSEU|nr:hypothetical protein SAMN05216215_101577 [Saccharopolyspora shandongensis]
MISRRIPLADINDVLAALKNPGNEMIRRIVTFD